MTGTSLMTAADASVGAAMLGCGAAAWRVRPRSRVGPLMLAVGVTWFAGNVVPAAVFWHRGPLVHLHLTYPTGRLRRRLAVATIVIAYLAAVVEAFVDDPRLTIGLAVLVAFAALDVFARATGPARKAGGPALVAALAFAAVLCLSGLNRWRDWGQDVAVLLTYDAVVLSVAVGLLMDLVRGRWTEAILADLVTDLGAARGTEDLRGRLRRALGDPSLALGYWLPARNGYVDDSGRPLAPEGDGRAFTHVVDDQGLALAVLVHDPAVTEDRALLDGVVAAFRLAVANARMQAEIRARTLELAASRRRLVQTADEQRRALQGQLADGAERRLADVDRLLADVAQTTDALAPELADVRIEVRGAREELREFARGLAPAALGGGLSSGVPQLAARSPVPVSVSVDVGRLPPAVEAALFFVCAEALTNIAKHACATEAAVVLRRDDDVVRLSVSDDGRGGADPGGSGLRGLMDRIEALGGRLTVRTDPQVGTVLRAEVPLGEWRQ